MSAARELVGAALDLFLGSTCAGCDRPGPALCLDCGAELQQIPFVAWPTPRPAMLPRPFAVTDYDGAAKAAIVAHKESAVLSIARPLGRALSLSVMSVLAGADAGLPADVPLLLVSPPTSASTVRTRGHDPLLSISRWCARTLRLSGIRAAPVRVLERTRDVADQSGLSATERADNLAGAFRTRSRARRGLAGRTVVVVDDILTTGATAADVTRALDGTGADVIGVAVVAATRRSHPLGAREPP